MAFCPGARPAAGRSVARAAPDVAVSSGTARQSAGCTKRYAPSCWPQTATHSPHCTWSWCPYGVSSYSRWTLTDGALCWQWRLITIYAENCRLSGATTRRTWWTGSERSGAWRTMRKTSFIRYAVFWRFDLFGYLLTHWNILMAVSVPVIYHWMRVKIAFFNKCSKYLCVIQSWHLVWNTKESLQAGFYA
jgi:hypothetical protein